MSVKCLTPGKATCFLLGLDHGEVGCDLEMSHRRFWHHLDSLVEEAECLVVDTVALQCCLEMCKLPVRVVEVQMGEEGSRIQKLAGTPAAAEAEGRTHAVPGGAGSPGGEDC